MKNGQHRTDKKRNMSTTIKKIFIFSTLLLIILPLSTVHGEISWIQNKDNDFTEFFYNVSRNSGTFFNYEDHYFVTPSETDQTGYRPAYGMFELNPLTNAHGTISAFAGQFQATAEAMGPSGAMPANGLELRGYTEIIGDETLGLTEGARTTQELVAWMTREFSVDESGVYSIEMAMTCFYGNFL